MAALRVLFVTDAFPPHAYGSGWSTYHLARGLRALGHDVRVVVAQPTVWLVETVYDGFPVWRPRDACRVLNPAAFAMSGLGPGRIVRTAIRTWQPHVIHAQHINATLVTHRAAAETPYVVTVRDHWPVCFYGTALAGTACPGCLHGTRSACNVRRGSPDAPAIARIAKASAMRAMLSQRRRVLRGAAAVIAASAWIGDEVARVVERSAIRIVPNAVDLSALRDEDEPAMADLPPRFFLYAGKLSGHKGADLLPAIVRALGEDTPPLLIVGDGDQEAELRAAGAGGARIRVIGRVPNATVVALMRRAIALITPARWPEPLSRTHLEALASGCPIVATDTGGTAEIVEHGVTGYLTAVDDVTQMAAHLRTLARDTMLRDRMSAASRARSQARFSLDAVARRHVEIYEATVRTT